MINAPIYIFDSIGCKFSILNNSFLIGQPLVGYAPLSLSHIGCHIPYLARNGSDWEVGVGYIVDNSQGIVVERLQIVKSSADNTIVSFTDTSKSEFYIFANESSFNVGFNNVIVKNNDFTIDKIQATYLVDSSNSVVYATLPNIDNTKNLIIEIKLVNGNNLVYISNPAGKIFATLSVDNSYIRIASDGIHWVGLNTTNKIELKSLSSDDLTFSTMSGINASSVLSFQYNTGDNNIGGAELYYGSGNKILFGDDVETSAHHIIPVSGSGNTIFNNDNANSNFIVEGSGTRNLFFDYRGRLGLNIPSGSSPDTIFHIVNTTCREGIRLENRTSCHPANITLYHSPVSAISANAIVAEINLAAKNSLGNQTDFSTIQSKAMDNTAGTSKGQLNIVVATSHAAGTGIKTISTDPDATIVGYSGVNLTVNNGGSASLGYNNSKVITSNNAVTIQSPAINLNSSNIILGTGLATNITVPTLYASHIQSNTIKIPNISQDSILTVNSSGYIVAGKSVQLPIEENKILTTAANGAITGIYNTSDYFLTNGDVLWNQYEDRPCAVAVRQILFDIPVPIEEFTIGDQVEVIVSGAKYYRDVADIRIDNNNIIELLLNQNITFNTVSSGTIQSVTQGGYLSITKTVEDSTLSDATSNVLSVRPYTDTVFNSKYKDINFSVYGVESVPSLSVRANSGRTTTPSGFFHPFASQKPQCDPCILYYPPNVDNVPFPIVVNSSGSGISTQHVSANFNSTALGIFSGMVTSVGTNGLPSFYGTYDQNGNVSEWIEDTSAISTGGTQFVAGGSWSTTTDPTIGASGLKHIESLPRISGYDYVGFRLASQYNLSDTNSLGLQFVSISNPNNIADTGNFYLLQDDDYISFELPNLGSVNKNYRIGTYEITNNQYSIFLNAVAQTNDRSLYKQQMTNDPVGGITRYGDGSTNPYEYTVKPNMGNKPVVFVDYLSVIRFINWLHNGALLVNILDIDSILDFGAYDIFPIGDSSYLVNKNIYQKYWLPNLNEWHKAAYFEPREGVISTGSSSVLIKREDPYTVISGTPVTQPLLANLSVSGWLYVDHLIVGDNIRSSSIIPRRVLPEGGTGGTGADGNQAQEGFICSANSDCEICEVCGSNGFCINSNDECCIADCCLPGGWNSAEGRCDLCSNCSTTGGLFGGGELPCTVLGTC
jgi:hypothetical protein